MTCTFFGHASFIKSIEEELKLKITSLINQGVSQFYVGNNGLFDLTVQTILAELSRKRTDFNYSVVLSRLNEASLTKDQSKTLFPYGLEKSLPRFAISKRNEWLIDNSDLVVCFVTHNYSNSYALRE